MAHSKGGCGRERKGNGFHKLFMLGWLKESEYIKKCFFWKNLESIGSI